jgi:hypothetical protein
VVKFKKENWHGQELISKVALWSIIGLELFIIPILDLITNNTTVGIFVIVGIGFYLYSLAYMNKSYAHKISKEFGGIRRWKVRYDLGRGRTGNIKFYIADMYPLKKAPKVLRDQVSKAKEIMYNEEIRIKEISEQGLKIDALSLLEESKSKKVQAIQNLRERDITKKTQSEYILDKLIQPYYEKEEKKDAFVKGKATKEFIAWKNSDGKALEALQKAVKTQILELDNKPSQKDLKERRLQIIGEEVALRVTLGEIIAADKGEAEGGAVHGFLKRQFDDYDDLIKKDQILDIAQDIAKEIWIPKIAKVIEKIHLDDCVETVVELYEEKYYDHEPHLPFKRMVVFAQEPLEDAVDWKERVPKTIHFFPDIPVTNGYSNIMVPTRITHDIPMVFVAHSPGKDYFVRNLQLDKDEIKKEKNQSLEDMIAEKDAQIIDTEEKANAHKQKEKTYRKITARTLQELDIVHNALSKEKLKRYEERAILGKSNIGKALLYLVIGICIIFLIIFLVNVSTGSLPMTNSTSTLSIIPSNYNILGNIGW